MASIQRIAPCLWFDDQAEAAVRFYIGIFDNSTVTRVRRYGEAGREIHGQAAGSVMAIDFELDGCRMTALNAGPAFTFNEAISLQVSCTTQSEVDRYWARLCEGGDEAAQQCGWLKDRFGVSWQVVPVALLEMLGDPVVERAERVMTAMLRMRKLDVEALRRAYDG